MNFLSLFSGIGGLDLGLERAGMTCIGQVEIDPFCQRVLAKNWPEVPRHDDVRTAAEWWLGRGGVAVDVVAGGPPCQPVSFAGLGRGADDDRWLWPATFDVVRQLRPRWVLLENVPGLLGRGMGNVLAELAACGYDTRWDCIPAAAVGALHRRDRVFIVGSLADPEGIRWGTRWARRLAGHDQARAHVTPPRPAATDPTGEGRRPGWAGRPGTTKARGQFAYWPVPARGDWWAAEPAVGRMAYGVPGRVDRLRALGNAVVPQVAEHIGRLMMAAAA